jgi:hypothetical protein
MKFIVVLKSIDSHIRSHLFLPTSVAFPEVVSVVCEWSPRGTRRIVAVTTSRAIHRQPLLARPRSYGTLEVRRSWNSLYHLPEYKLLLVATHCML